MNALPTSADVSCPVCGTAPGTSCVNRNDDAPTSEHIARLSWAEYIWKFRPFVAILTTGQGDLAAGSEVEVRKLPGDTLAVMRNMADGKLTALEVPLDSARFHRLLAA